jgi:hypothetical protein
VRRSLAAILLSLAQLLGSGALAGWWMSETVFDTSRSREVADVVLADDAVRDQVSAVIADAAAAQLGQDPATVRAIVDQAARTPQGSIVLAEVVVDAHAKVIGERDEPVTVDPVQLLPILGPGATGLPAIVVPVPTVSAFDWVRRGLDVFVPIAAIAALVCALLAVAIHPDRARLLRFAGVGMLVMAVLVILLGYVLPGFAARELTDSPWAATLRAVAEDSLQLLAGISLVLVGGGVAALTAASAMRRRQQQRQLLAQASRSSTNSWNTPA